MIDKQIDNLAPGETRASLNQRNGIQWVTFSAKVEDPFQWNEDRNFRQSLCIRNGADAHPVFVFSLQFRLADRTNGEIEFLLDPRSEDTEAILAQLTRPERFTVFLLANCGEKNALRSAMPRVCQVEREIGRMNSLLAAQQSCRGC